MNILLPPLSRPLKIALNSAGASAFQRQPSFMFAIRPPPKRGSRVFSVLLVVLLMVRPAFSAARPEFPVRALRAGFPRARVLTAPRVLNPPRVVWKTRPGGRKKGRVPCAGAGPGEPGASRAGTQSSSSPFSSSKMTGLPALGAQTFSGSGHISLMADSSLAM